MTAGNHLPHRRLTNSHVHSPRAQPLFRLSLALPDGCWRIAARHLPRRPRRRLGAPGHRIASRVWLRGLDRRSVPRVARGLLPSMQLRSMWRRSNHSNCSRVARSRTRGSIFRQPVEKEPRSTRVITVCVEPERFEHEQPQLRQPQSDHNGTGPETLPMTLPASRASRLRHW